MSDYIVKENVSYKFVRAKFDDLVIHTVVIKPNNSCQDFGVVIERGLTFLHNHEYAKIKWFSGSKSLCLKGNDLEYMWHIVKTKERRIKNESQRKNQQIKK